MNSRFSPSQLASTRTLALLASVLLVLAAVPGTAAADARVGGSVVVPEGQTVDGLEAFGGSVVVRGTVDGDLSAVGGDVTVAATGRVMGDVQTAAGNVHVAGTVDGDVRAAAGDLTIAEGATVGGHLEAGAGAVHVDGAIRGDVTVGAETVVLGPSASVAGDLTYDGRLTGNRDAVAGTIERDASLSGPLVLGPEIPVLFNWGLGLYGFVVNLLLGALLVYAFPGFSRRVAAEAVDAPFRAWGAGLLAVVAVPVALVLVALTVFGIPLSIAGLLLFWLLGWVATIYGRFAVGTWLVRGGGTERPWAALVVGSVAVTVGVRLPGVGWFVNVLVFLLGLGALTLAIDDRRRARTRRARAEPADVVGPAGSDDGETSTA